MTLLVGIDGGGTTCRAALVDNSGRQLARAEAGPANLMTDLDGAARNIIASVADALNRADLPAGQISQVSAAMGVAGANVGDYAARLPALLPFRDCLVETDAMISLRGAFENDDGAVAAIGTGSIFIYRLDGEVHVSGGWGLAVGDQCSGARLGQVLLEQALLAYDRVEPPSPLTDRVLDRFGGDPQAVVEYAQGARPSDYGIFAPWVFEAYASGDPVALRLVDGAVDILNRILGSILRSNSLPLCMLGGLGPVYADLVASEWKARLRPPRADALAGAIALAVQSFATPQEATA